MKRTKKKFANIKYFLYLCNLNSFGYSVCLKKNKLYTLMKTKSILILIATVALAACGGKSAKTSADGQQAAQLQTQSAEDAFKSE